MTDLTIPRYKVIENYPDSRFKVGTIIEKTKDGSPNVWGGAGDYILIGVLKKYPNLFKELEWWKEREIEDMPTYIRDKTAIPNKIINTEIFGYNREEGYFKLNGGDPIYMWGLVPATEQEYLTQKDI